MKIDWKRVRHFSPNENWGDPNKIVPELVYRLDAFREYLGKKIHINCGWDTKGHTPHSQHYIGRAVDISFFSHTVDLFSLYLAAERFGFNGIGLYPDWSYPGLHLDVRILNPNAPKRRWMRIDRNNLGYISLTAEHIIKYLVKN